MGNEELFWIVLEQEVKQVYHWTRTNCLVSTVLRLQHLHSDIVSGPHHFRTERGFKWPGAEFRLHIADITIYVKLLLIK